MHFTQEQFWHSTPEKIRLLWDEYCRLTNGEEEKKPQGKDIVYRNGKPYRKVSGKDAKWINN
jgi:hypothetical protein